MNFYITISISLYNNFDVFYMSLSYFLCREDDLIKAETLAIEKTVFLVNFGITLQILLRQNILEVTTHMC